MPRQATAAPITIIETREEARRVAVRLRRAGILGIDTETRPSFTAGVRYEVSLLQIATEEECFLFRLNKMGLPKSLISLLEDPAIIKVGLSLRDDITALSRREAFTPGSFVELQKLADTVATAELLKLDEGAWGEGFTTRARPAEDLCDPLR